jgi:hypothetical protein
MPAAAVTQTGSTLLTVLGWLSLAAAFLSAALILARIARGDRDEMAVMNWVWPITALYWGPLAAWAHRCRDRLEGGRWSIAKAVSHCGAGCTLGDIGGEWIVYLTAWTIPLFAAAPANSLVAMFVADFVLAWSLGIAFQYFSIAPAREDLGRLAGIAAAIKADTLSIVSFQVGLFGFMALYHLVLFKPPLTVASPGYWLMMQIGMIVGFFTAWPANVWLVRRGIKEAM